MTTPLLILAGFFVVEAIATIAMVGKPRETRGPKASATIYLVNLACFIGLFYLGVWHAVVTQ